MCFCAAKWRGFARFHGERRWNCWRIWIWAGAKWGVILQPETHFAATRDGDLNTRRRRWQAVCARNHLDDARRIAGEAARLCGSDSGGMIVCKSLFCRRRHVTPSKRSGVFWVCLPLAEASSPWGLVLRTKKNEEAPSIDGSVRPMRTRVIPLRSRATRSAVAGPESMPPGTLWRRTRFLAGLLCRSRSNAIGPRNLGPSLTRPGPTCVAAGQALWQPTARRLRRTPR
jgi:hypothetical protein